LRCLPAALGTGTRLGARWSRSDCRRRGAHRRQLTDAAEALLSSEAPKMGLARARISLVAAISRRTPNRVQTRSLREHASPPAANPPQSRGPPLPLDAAVWASTGSATDRRPHVVRAPI
jgi:hypothetical protein